MWGGVMAPPLTDAQRAEILQLLRDGHSVTAVVHLTHRAAKVVARVRDAHGVEPFPRGRRQTPQHGPPPEDSLRVFREAGVRLIRAGFPPVSTHPDRACKDADPALFFTEQPGHLGKRVEERAKAICAGCPVLEDCRAWALPITDLYGLWAGMTMREREDWRINNSAEAS
jgi:WhiB family transcriptional regulator, redox-sensing transcriptional regulator